MENFIFCAVFSGGWSFDYGMELQKWWYTFFLLVKIVDQNIRKKITRPQNTVPFLTFWLLLCK